MLPRWLFTLILLLSNWIGGTAAAGPVVMLNQLSDAPIGLDTGFLQEKQGRLTLSQARQALVAGAFQKSEVSVLNFGIGAAPVWIHVRVENPADKTVIRRLSIDTGWLDHLNIYVVHGGRTQSKYHLGDRQPFAQRPVDSRYFLINQSFRPGISDVFFRVQTPDPMVVPIFLQTLPQANAREKTEDFGYGLLYGFIIALLAYNAMLYVGLRVPRYILYSLYLGMFLLMNISYTGHGFAWWWPDSTRWAQWSQPTLMMLYASSGLVFALSFLDIRRYFPRLFRMIVGYIALAGALLLYLIVGDHQRLALLLAFTYVSLFTLIMLVLGIFAVRGGVRAAKYFLLAAFSAMVGAALTALAVWGFIPFNGWTYRAIDIGMALDATLLALALTFQFRIGQQERVRAEELARIDPLTGVNNRRAFYDISAPICNITMRHGRDLSVILLDLDHFKLINDNHGHICGDEVLQATAAVLKRSIRDHDVVARWGGEEFILLLPETDLDEATALAERLRQAVEAIQLICQGKDIRITASFGVAQKSSEIGNLGELITAADKQLYRAKDGGRNRVCHA